MGIEQTKYSVLDAEIRLITNKVELSAPVIFDKKKDICDLQLFVLPFFK